MYYCCLENTKILIASVGNVEVLYVRYFSLILVMYLEVVLNVDQQMS
jgi:hypothetical protein